MSFWDNLRHKEAIIRSCHYADILHGHFDLVPSGITLASRRLVKPLVIDCEADHFDEWRLKDKHVSPILVSWARMWQKKCLDTAQAIICVSEELRDYLAIEWALPSQKLYVIQNGVDTDLFKPLSPDIADEWRQRLGINDAPTIVFVGIFSERHALEGLIDSFSIILRQLPNCILLLVGDGIIRPKLEARIAEKGITSSVKITGKVDLEEIPKLLSLADITVSPSVDVKRGSDIKTSPLKVLEYMAAGKASIVTAAGQSKEIIDHGITGLLVPANDVEAFAQAAIRLLKNTDERRQMGEQARKVAVSKHSWSRYGEKLQEIYSNIL
jgi:glycosyltransferase involved in cell wall biosynthesis